MYLNQFKAGTVAFTTVVTAEVALLADEEAELTVRQNLFLASVSLIEALGGGWDTTLLPTQVQLQKGFSLVPKLESPSHWLWSSLPKVQTPSNPPYRQKAAAEAFGARCGHKTTATKHLIYGQIPMKLA